MPVEDALKNLQDRVNNKVKQIGRKDRLAVYSPGLKAKLRQCDIAIYRLKKFAAVSDNTTDTTDRDEPKIEEQVSFYCDAFWTCLYSSLDILGQIINQTHRLGLDEDKVSFYKVLGELEKQKNSDLVPLFKRCMNRRACKNLAKYRSCSTHRRQIYIEVKTAEVTGTLGYSPGTTTSTGETAVVIRTLCDDPNTLRPKTNKNRTIPDFLIDTLETIEKDISAILEAIEPKT